MAVKLHEMQTPTLVLDEGKMQSNIDRMAARARSLGIPLRPHLKTPKCVEVAKKLSDKGARGFNVSTLTEAEYFFRAGFDDLFYCVPFAPNKAARAAKLVADGCRLTLMTDSLAGARAATEALEASTNDVVLPFVIEIDVDGYRTGMPYQNPELIEAAQWFQHSPSTRFAGIMSYAGASYGKTPDQAGELADLHHRALLEAVGVLAKEGLACEMVSLGSTPAVLHATALPGISEIRCGIYVFQDLFQAGIGACEISDIAVSVLACVISQQPHNNRFAIDAGGLALSKDRSTGGTVFDADYGMVCDAKSGEPIDDLFVTAVSQELGLVTSRSGKAVNMGRFSIGSQVRILPNHADMTAAAYESYAVVRGSDVVTDVWARINRWS